MAEFESLENVLEKHIPAEELKDVKRVLYGKQLSALEVSAKAQNIADKNDFELKGYKFEGDIEELTPTRVVRVGVVQHKIVLPTTAPLEEQRAAIFKKITTIVGAAAECGVNVLCFQELWAVPFFLPTREIHPWCQLAESAEDGPSVQLVQQMAREHGMVIVSSILERDSRDKYWNTAVVVDRTGHVLGKSRKNHIPRCGDCNETTYYGEGDLGHPVFETEFGKIAVAICFDRHHPLNWMMYGINGAEIVFHPAAIGRGSEPLWGIEARNAAIANSYYVCAINRVGTEVFPRAFSLGADRVTDSEAPGNTAFYAGSSYVAAPDGSRTHGLSRTRDGLLVTQMDLNLCRQASDRWGFKMTQRLDLYSTALTAAAKPDYKQQIVRATK